MFAALSKETDRLVKSEKVGKRNLLRQVSFSCSRIILVTALMLMAWFSYDLSTSFVWLLVGALSLMEVGSTLIYLHKWNQIVALRKDWEKTVGKLGEGTSTEALRSDHSKP